MPKVIRQVTELPLDFDLTVGAAHIVVRSGKGGTQVQFRVGN